MFEGDLTDAVDGRPAGVGRRAPCRGQPGDARLLEHAQVYADRHHPDLLPGPPGPPLASDGRERAVVLGGDGCPEIAEFAVAEFGVDARDLAQGRRRLHRPGVGVAAPVPVHLGPGPGRRGDPWKACRIAAACLKLSEEAAALRRPAGRRPSWTRSRRTGWTRSSRPPKLHADPDAGPGRGRREGPRTRRVRRPLRRARHQDHVHQGRLRRRDPARRHHRRHRRRLEDLRRHPPGPAPARRRGRHHRRPPLHRRTPPPSPPTPPQPTPAPTTTTHTDPTAPTPADAARTPTAPQPARQRRTASRPTAPADRPAHRQSGHGWPRSGDGSDPAAADVTGAECRGEPGLDDEADRDAPHPSDQRPARPARRPSRDPVEPFDPGLRRPRRRDPSGEPARRRRPTRPMPASPRSSTTPTPPTAAPRRCDRAASRPGGRLRPGKTEIYVHLTDHTLATGTGVLRVEGIGPLLAAQLSRTRRPRPLHRQAGHRPQRRRQCRRLRDPRPDPRTHQAHPPGRALPVRHPRNQPHHGPGPHPALRPPRPTRPNQHREPRAPGPLQPPGEDARPRLERPPPRPQDAGMDHTPRLHFPRHPTGTRRVQPPRRPPDSS